MCLCVNGQLFFFAFNVYSLLLLMVVSAVLLFMATIIYTF